MSELALSTELADTFGKGSISDMVEEYRSGGWHLLDPGLKVFCFEYVNQYDHTAAAVKAGIPKDHGLKTLRNPLVQAFIQDIIEDRQLATSITHDYVSAMWMKILPKLMGDEEVNMVTSSGQEISACKFHASEAIGALREMSKSTKFYEQGSGQGGLNLSIAITADMSPQEASQEYMKMVKGEVL